MGLLGWQAHEGGPSPTAAAGFSLTAASKRLRISVTKLCAGRAPAQTGRRKLVSGRTRHQRIAQIQPREESNLGKANPCMRVGDHAGEA